LSTPTGSGHYQLLPIADIIIILRALQEEFEDYLHYGLGYRKDQYIVSGVDIIDAIVRVDKRESYFYYFHNMKINDEKKAALYAYWIAKFHPVKFTDEFRNKKAHANVNEKLAMNHLIAALVRKGRIKLWDGKDGVKIEESKFYDELCYSFRFRNFTIDSMIILADSITTDSFKEKKTP
jgi:hypothetical protein